MTVNIAAAHDAALPAVKVDYPGYTPSFGVAPNLRRIDYGDHVVWQGLANDCVATFMTRDADLVLTAKPLIAGRYQGVELVNPAGSVLAHSVRFW